MLRHPLRLAAAFAATLATLPSAFAAGTSPGQDLLVQAPSIGQPQRGSLDGSLARLSFGPAHLARGT